ncbi:CBS domain-containing protein [bacterium]|nr:CBS domain-containing protein [bacterium]
MVARDIMRKDAPTLKPGDPLCHAAKTMLSTGCSEVAVVDGNGGLVGLLTEADVLRATLPTYVDGLDLSFLPSSFDFPAEGSDLQTITVAQALRNEAHEVVSEDDPLVEVARVIAQEHVIACPVVARGAEEDKPGRYVGIINYSDLLRYVLSSCLGQGEA